MDRARDVRFAKGHALGNDYAVIDAADLPGAPSPALVRAFCDRHRGIGSDGILLGDVASKPFGLRIFNPDGTEAEKSGNGLRIFGAWLHGRGLVAGDPFTVRLARDEVGLQVEGPASGGALRIAVAMGRPSFEPADVGFDAARAAPGGAPVGAPGEYRLELGDAGTVAVNPVSLGNPHAVVLVDRLERDDFLRRAPRVCTHPAFVAGTNVQFARVAGPAALEAWIWERGAAETLASGSSACAVAAVARRRGLVSARTLEVRMPGGVVVVEVDDAGALHLRGPAQIVYTGVVRREVWNAWEAGEDG